MAAVATLFCSDRVQFPIKEVKMILALPALVFGTATSHRDRQSSGLRAYGANRYARVHTERETTS
jgi:hypothetical protein